MIKRLLNYKYELLSFVSLNLIILFQVIIYKKSIQKGSFAYVLLIILSAISLLAFIYFVCKLIRKLFKKQISSITTALGKIIEKLFNIIQEILEKVFPNKDSEVIHGKTTMIKFNGFTKTHEKKASPKPRLTWKQLDDNRQKLSFLYVKMIENKIEKGEYIYSTQTPREVMEKHINSDTEHSLFKYYISTRYNHKCTVTQDELNEIKRDL